MTVGDLVWVAVTEIKDGGKVALSMSQVDQESGELKEADSFAPMTSRAPASNAQAPLQGCPESGYISLDIYLRIWCLSKTGTRCSAARWRGFNPLGASSTWMASPTVSSTVRRRARFARALVFESVCVVDVAYEALECVYDRELFSEEKKSLRRPRRARWNDGSRNANSRPVGRGQASSTSRNWRATASRARAQRHASTLRGRDADPRPRALAPWWCSHLGGSGTFFTRPPSRRDQNLT